MAQTPVLVIVPGSFAPVSFYFDFVDYLKENGIDARVVDTPSVGRRDPQPAATMSDDVKEVESVVMGVFDEGRDVVIMAHSYGGVPTTQSMKTLSRKNRQGRSIERVIYLTAVILPVDVDNMTLSGGTLPDWVKIDGDYMILTDPQITGSLTFSDLPEHRSVELAKNMGVHSLPSFKEKLTYAGYNDVDVHYILCGKDKIIAPEHQQAMIGMIEQSSGKAPTVHKLDSDHAPSYSHPEELLAILRSILSGPAQASSINLIHG